MYSKPGHGGGVLLRNAAFTILELMIVVSIIGLLAVMAIPAMTKQRMRMRDTAFLNDLRVLLASFEQYAIEHGDYPPDAGPGVAPPGFASYTPQRLHWDEEAHIGGTWEWDRASDHDAKIHGVYAALSVVNPKRTSLQMAEIDAKIDDGDIETGRFRRRDGGYMYVLTE